MENKKISWQEVKPVIDACKEMSDYYKNKSQALIEQANAPFFPLTDPLCVDYSSCRFFKREEDYSDWLSYIIMHLEDPKLIFTLLRIDSKVDIEKCKGINIRVEREFFSEKGHDDQSGRLDILISYPPELLIVLEVKVCDAESADICKNDGYYDYIESNFRENIKHYELLVTDAEKKSYNKADSFKVLKWEEVCKGLRGMVIDGSVKKPLVCALMLILAGAVEQKLLKYDCLLSDRYDSRTIEYLNCTTDGKEYYLDMDEIKRKFMNEGLSKYLDAQWVIQEFEQEIMRRIKKVLDSKIDDLSGSMNTRLKDKSISQDNDKKNNSKEWARIGWTIGGFEQDSPLNVIFFSFYIERKNANPQSSVAISYQTSSAPVRNILKEKCQKLGEVECEGNSISLGKVLETNANIDLLECELDQLVDKWSRVWSSIDGGVEGLKRCI